MYPKNAGSVLCLLNRTDYYVLLYQKNSWLFVLEMHLISGMTDGGKGCEPLPPGKLNVQSGPLPSLSFGSFFKENVRYPVWTCRNPISVILVTRFSLILGIQFSILGARIGSLKHLKKLILVFAILLVSVDCCFFPFFEMFSSDSGFLYSCSIPDSLLFLNFSLGLGQGTPFSLVSPWLKPLVTSLHLIKA